MISFNDVHKTYKSKSGEVEALKGITFDIEDGEFVFIIGKSGSGKSTLMKCITCEETPNEGDVLIDGFSISSMSRALVPVLRRNIGMVYQDFRLIESKTVSENIAFAGEIVGIPKKNLDKTVQFMLNLVGLREKADAYPNELSGGEQQRIAIARAMVNNPKIMVADEPTGNLDPETSENIMALLQDINRSGATVIVCTHDSNLVDRMKKRVIEIEAGLIARDQKDSKYTEEITPDNKPTTISNVPVAFGDDPAFNHDREYTDNYDDDEYSAPVEVPPSEFFFGDSPVSNTAVVPVSETQSVEDADNNVVSTDDTPDEPIAEEKAEDTKAEPVVDISFGDEKPEEPKEEKSEDAPAGDDDSCEDKTTEKAADDDDWMKKIHLDDNDIDLDIQEDDE